MNIRNVRQYENAIVNQVNVQPAKSSWHRLTRSQVRAQSVTLSRPHERGDHRGLGKLRGSKQLNATKMRRKVVAATSQEEKKRVCGGKETERAIGGLPNLRPKRV